MSVRDAVTLARRWMLAGYAETLTALAFVAGWLLLTAGVASIVGAISPRFVAAVWLVSSGLLALSLGGWKLLALFVRDGLYSLTRGN